MGGGSRRTQFTGHHIRPLTSYFRRRIIGWGFLSQGGRFLACLFICCLSSFFSPGFASTVSFISVVILEQLGILLFTYSFSECDTNHSSLQAKGVGQGQLLFIQILWPLVQLMLVVKLYKTNVLKLGPSDCWGPAACASRDE